MKFDFGEAAMTVGLVMVGVIATGLVFYNFRDIKIIAQAGDGFDY